MQNKRRRYVNVQSLLFISSSHGISFPYPDAVSGLKSVWRSASIATTLMILLAMLNNANRIRINIIRETTGGGRLTNDL